MRRNKMENPAFLDSDHSVYENARGSYHSMSQRRQWKKQQHQHQFSSTHSAPRVKRSRILDASENKDNEGESEIYNDHHQGNMVGVMAIPEGGTSHMVPAGRVPGMIVQVSGGAPTVHTATTTTLYQDPSLPTLYSAQVNSPNPQNEFLYSCETSTGNEHVYQCPELRGNHLDYRAHHQKQRQRQIEPGKHNVHIDRNQQYSNHYADPSLDHRPEYHYGGSDYSSTEPIYAQPQLIPRENVAGTPTIDYNNGLSSLRSASVSSYHLSSVGGTPAKYLVQTDSCSESTSSTLPTVSAHLRSPNNVYVNSTSTHVSHPSLRSSGRNYKDLGFSSIGRVSTSSGIVMSTAPAKLKRQGVFRRWKVKFFQDEEGKRKTCLFVVALLLVVLLVIGALATVLYLTIGGGAFVGESPKLIGISETGSNVVEAEFRITNQNFWEGLENPHSEEFRSMAQSIEIELDRLFFASVWSNEYNHSQVISMAEGSLIVQAQMFLNIPDETAAQKLGSAFLRGLRKRHESEWLGQYSVDITSIKFTEVLIDTPTSSTPISQTSPSGEIDETIIDDGNNPPVPRRKAEWGEWGPWSSCSPCSPQYDQIRTRKCHWKDGGSRLAIDIEQCLQSTSVENHVQSISGDINSRHCLCPHIENRDKDSKEVETINRPIMPSTPPPWRLGEPNKENDVPKETPSERLCSSCLPGEVCVALQGESFPSCRSALNLNDRTGCGGLCVIDSEVCQAVGTRAFQCHSASLCLHDEWRCDDGLCIPFTKRCDGLMNCYDRSDEQQCQCGINQFKCGNNTSCLPVTVKCDGELDCWDGSDEANCSSVSVSTSSNGATEWQIVGMGLMNPQDISDGNKQTSLNGEKDGTSQLPSSGTGVLRVGTPAMNRTAVGLSRLSNRERELLS